MCKWSSMLAVVIVAMAAAAAAQVRVDTINKVQPRRARCYSALRLRLACSVKDTRSCRRRLAPEDAARDGFCRSHYLLCLNVPKWQPEQDWLGEPGIETNGMAVLPHSKHCKACHATVVRASHKTVQSIDCSIWLVQATYSPNSALFSAIGPVTSSCSSSMPLMCPVNALEAAKIKLLLRISSRRVLGQISF